MNVVVSAIVDPWVTTLSFVVALAMRIQDFKPSKSIKDYNYLIQMIKENIIRMNINYILNCNLLNFHIINNKN